MYFAMKIDWFTLFISDHKFEDCIDLLMITEKSRSHYVYIKDFNRSMCNKTKCKSKKTNANVVYNVLTVKEFWYNMGTLLI